TPPSDPTPLSLLSEPVAWTPFIRLRVYGQCFPDSVSLCLAPSPCTRLSRAPSTVWASPTSTVASASLRMVRSVGILDPPTARPRRRWISQVPDASVSGRAVLLDPAAVSGSHCQ